MLFLFYIFLFSAFPCLFVLASTVEVQERGREWGGGDKTKASIKSHKGQNCHRSGDKTAAVCSRHLFHCRGGRLRS